MTRLTPTRALLAFLAAFIATLVFHQGGLAVLHAAGLTERTPFAMKATPPFGAPAVISLAFWGGVWGIVLAWVIKLRGALGSYLLQATVFGALLPTAVALFIVAPLKGLPIAAGGDPKLILGGVILNGLWGLGTGLIFYLLARQGGPSSPSA